MLSDDFLLVSFRVERCEAGLKAVLHILEVIGRYCNFYVMLYLGFAAAGKTYTFS
jgi:hypothetical protein